MTNTVTTLILSGITPDEFSVLSDRLLQSYTPESAQAEIERIFSMQYTLTLTEEVEIRYRTETSTDPETGETTTEEVPYEYHILNVKLTNKPISEIAKELLTPEQFEMFKVYLETSGNKPLIFGGGSPDTGGSEDLSGVHFVERHPPRQSRGYRPCKTSSRQRRRLPLLELVRLQFPRGMVRLFCILVLRANGLIRAALCGLPVAGCPLVPKPRAMGARGYENLAPGDAIFFDWDLDGSADHVGLVIGTDGSRVYTVEGNSGDACKIKSYSLDYECIKGYGLMNWD